MRNGWTGGQYSVYRAFFGLYLLIHFATTTALFPDVLERLNSPGLVAALAASGALLSVAFAAGYRDRVAALLLGCLWFGLEGSRLAASTTGTVYVGLLLLAHVFLPAAPFGAWSARLRSDPAGGWRMPDAIHASAWVLLALGYAASGVAGLVYPSPDGLPRVGTWVGLGLELAFAPLALFRRVRPWIWLAALIVHLSRVLLVDAVELNMGLVLLHFFTFDPAWIRPEHAAGEETLFYDGGCGLCHAGVRAVLAEDRSGSAFRFAPLGGATFASLVPAAERGDLPDSIFVVRANGPMLTRSRAVAHIGRRLGGLWRPAGSVLGLVPTALADGLYDLIASVRYRVFRRPVEACPILPAGLRSRFDD